MSKLNKEAIDEIMYLLTEVKDVVRLLKEFHINITSDPWRAISSYDCNRENILVWEKEDFETLDKLETGDVFYIGGNVVTGTQHHYKNKWIIAPKELADVQGKIFKEYLQQIIESVSLKHFELKFNDEYGLIDNCGWEHYLAINTKIKRSALVDEETNQFLENFFDNYTYDYVYTRYDDSYDNISTVDNLNGYDDKYDCMIEIFSNLIDPSNYEPSELTGDVVTDEYIDAIVKERDRMRKLAKEIECRYKAQGVKVTLSKWNVGCEFGMAIYVWIPSQ